MNQKRLARWLVAALLLAGGAAAVYYTTRPRPVSVVVRAVDRGSVEATVANTRAGTVKACRRAKLSPQAGGRVAVLSVRRGDRVKAGTLLLELWHDDILAQQHLAESDVSAARSLAEQACLSAGLAAREAQRIETLLREGVVGEQAADRARADRDTTQAACQAAKARVAQAVASVEVTRRELAKTVLTAPFDGVIAEVNAELGEIVTPSPPGIPTPPAIDLIEEGCLYVTAPIDEVDAPRVQVGQSARVTLDAFAGRTFPATIRRVAPYVLDREKQARTVDVEAEIASSAELPALIAGYSADLEVLLERRDDVLRVPTEAVSEQHRVLVLDGKHLAERSIEPGLASWQYTEVLSGLKEGDRVVVSLDRPGVEPGALAVAEPETKSGAERGR